MLKSLWFFINLDTPLKPYYTNRRITTVIKPAIIFRGKGVRISRDEICAYHPGVDVYWQVNVWVDTDFCVNLADKTVRVSERSQ